MITFLQKTTLLIILITTFSSIQAMHIEGQTYISRNQNNIIHNQNDSFNEQKKMFYSEKDIELLKSFKHIVEQNSSENALNNRPIRYGHESNNPKDWGIPPSSSETREVIQKIFAEDNPHNNPEISAILYAARCQEPSRTQNSIPLFSILDIINNIDVESLKVAKQQLLNEKEKIEYEIKQKWFFQAGKLKKQQFLINNQLIFIEYLIDGTISHLLHHIEVASPTIARQSFETLCQVWPWRSKYPRIEKALAWLTGRTKSFLCDSLITPEQEEFIDLLSCNIMQRAEMCLMSRQNVLHAMNPQQCGSIQDAFNNYQTLQIRGEGQLLLIEKCVLENLLIFGYNVDAIPSLKANLAIINYLLSDPLTETYAYITYGDLKTAHSKVCEFEQKIGIECINNNIFTYDKACVYVQKTYGYDVLNIVRSRYVSHSDYKGGYESIFSHSLMQKFATIAGGDFQSANNALKDLEEQMIEKYGSVFSDPHEVYNTMFQNEGFDVIEAAYKALESRSDYQERKHELISTFEPINSRQNILELIDSYTDNITFASELEKFSNKVFDYISEHGCIVPTTIELEVDTSIGIIKITENPFSLIFNVAKVDHLLADALAFVNYSNQHLPSLIERSPDLIFRFGEKLIKGINPVEQGKNLYHFVSSVDTLIGNCWLATGKAVFNMAMYPRETSEKICKFIVDTACFVSDVTIGTTYLPEQELQNRVDKYCITFDTFSPKNLADSLSAEIIIDVFAQTVADVIFFGSISKAAKFIKQIEAIGKIKGQASNVAKKFKKAFDNHLVDNPILVTAEGAQIKATSEIASQAKNISKMENITKISSNTNSSTQNIIKQAENQLEKTATVIVKNIAKEATELLHTFNISKYDPSIGNLKKLEEAIEKLKNIPGALTTDGPLFKTLEYGQKVEVLTDSKKVLEINGRLATARGAMYEVEKALELLEAGEEIVELGKKISGREFDIVTKTKLIECKNIDWTTRVGKNAEKMKSDLGDWKHIAKKNNKIFELHSKKSIPTIWKDLLTKMNINFIEDNFL